MRKEIDVTIAAEGRDKGKVFALTEMGAVPAEKWSIRALLALAKGGVQLPEGIMSAGAAAIPMAIQMIAIGGLGSLDFAEIEPLLDEMLLCVRVRPKPEVTRPLILDQDIEEIATLLTLRREILDLHYNFSKAADPSESKPMETAATGLDTQTSQA